MIPMVHLLVTDTGEYKIPEGMAAIYRACKIRGDGQPDARTKHGRIWYREFRKFSAEKMAEYMAA